MSPRHTRYQTLTAAILLAGLVPVTFALSTAGEVQLLGAFFGWNVAVYLAGAAGTLLAATTFARGEPMRPGWFLLSISYLALLPSTLVNGPLTSPLYAAGVRAPWLLVVCNVASGTCSVAGVFVLARVWRSSGLDPTSARSQWVARAAALVVAAALAGPDLVDQLPGALQGDPSALVNVLTDLLDGAFFVVAVPVLRAALALGGGLVFWPWAMLTLSVLSWLGYDAIAVYGEAMGLGVDGLRVAEEVFRSLGPLFAFGAGAAQRWVMTEQAQPAPAAAAAD